MTGPNSDRVLDRVRLLGLATDFMLNHGDQALDRDAVARILSDVSQASQEVGIVDAAAQAMVSLSRETPLFPTADVQVNSAFAVHVVRDLLGDRRGPELRPEFLREAESARELIRVVRDGGDREEVTEVVWNYVKPWLRTDDEPVSTVGLGYSVEIATAVNDTSRSQRAHIDLVVDTVAHALRSASFDVLPPNTHANSDEPGGGCRHESNFDVLVAVAVGGSWRGGHQVRRAHAHLKPVLAVVPEGVSPSCVFDDRRSGWVVPVTYNDPAQLGGSLIDALEEIVFRLSRGQERILDLVLIDREVYEETRAAFLGARRDPNWRDLLETWMPLATATHMLSSIEAFQGSSRLQMNLLRTTLDLPILGAERYETLRGVLSEDHRVAVDSFVERFDIPPAGEIGLLEHVVHESMEGLVDSHRNRSKRYLHHDELMAAWKQISGE